MPTVSLVHTKGGVAKTTSAVYLATAAQRRGRDVVLIDADPQGSALEWAAAAQDDPFHRLVVPEDHAYLPSLPDDVGVGHDVPVRLKDEPAPRALQGHPPVVVVPDHSHGVYVDDALVHGLEHVENLILRGRVDHP